jgi:hypothetical protein
MDSQKPGGPMDEVVEEEDMDDVDELDMEDDEEEVEITRDELVAALQEVVTDLSTGLKGDDRDAYMGADDLAQNDWFFAGVSDQEGTYSVTMWPAEGEDDMLRIDIGTEEDVHKLASNPEMVESMTDEFITAMEDEDGYDDEDEDEEFEEYDEEDEEDEEDDMLDEDEDEDEDMMDDEDMEDEETVSRDGNMPPR